MTKLYTIEGHGEGWKEIKHHKTDHPYWVSCQQFPLDDEDEALVLVRKKGERLHFGGDMTAREKEPNPDYNSPEWEKVPEDDYRLPGLQYVTLRRKTPTNPMPEIKPGDIIEHWIGGTYGVYGEDLAGYLNCFCFSTQEYSLIAKPDIRKIKRPNQGVIWEKKS